MLNPSDRRNRWTVAGTLVVLALVQLVVYQNCGSDFIVKDGLSFSAGSSSVCEASLVADFQSSYYSFLKTNCATCHTSGGSGNGAFADSNMDVAFSAFLNVGHERIDINATNTAHSGNSGSQHTSAVATAGQQWENASASCKGGGGSTSGGTQVRSVEKVMGATTTAKDISWNLDSEINQAGSTSGATLTIAVRQIPSPNGTPVYYFSNPRLKAGTRSVRLKGLMININGQEQVLGSTWSRADSTAAAGATVTMSTAQVMLEYPAFSASDTLSVTIDSLTTQ
jgi:hypothetical protein